ncbi:hypothetical protein C0989_008122 [Termitomyces sp. Mn162]|nr:hypothetical protein C0989_008122 [Termitomyces sp. Mn162]
MAVGGARIIMEKEACPFPNPTDPNTTAIVNVFNLRSNQAAGEIYQWLNKGNKIQVEGAMQHIQALCPPPISDANGKLKEVYIMEMLDNKLSIMAVL